MINIDEYEKYIKETNWKEHEYINPDYALEKVHS